MSSPWSAFYWRDYIAKTGHLTLAEHGAYLLLMAHYYMTGSLPANAQQLHRICRCTTDAERDACTAVVAEFFTVDGESYKHTRIEEELTKASEISDKRRKAALSRHANAPANAPANAEQLHTQPQPQPQPHKEGKGSPVFETGINKPGEWNATEIARITCERLDFLSESNMRLMMDVIKGVMGKKQLNAEQAGEFVIKQWETYHAKNPDKPKRFFFSDGLYLEVEQPRKMAETPADRMLARMKAAAGGNE